MLSADQLNVLSDQQKETVANMEALFASSGWDYLQEWIRNSFELATQRCLTAPNWDSYVAARAQRSSWELWQNLETVFEAEYAGYAEDAVKSALDEAATLEDFD